MSIELWGQPIRRPIKASDLLPFEAHIALQSAARVLDAFERAKAINRASKSIKHKFPQYFR